MNSKKMVIGLLLGVAVFGASTIKCMVNTGLQAESSATCSKADKKCQDCAILKAQLQAEPKQKSFRNAIDIGSQIGLYLASGSSQEVQWAGSMVGGALGGLVHLSFENPVGRAVVFAVPSAVVCCLAGGAIINRSAMTICAQLGFFMPTLREMYVDLDLKRRKKFIVNSFVGMGIGCKVGKPFLGLMVGSIGTYVLEKKKQRKEQKMVQELVKELACKD